MGFCSKKCWLVCGLIAFAIITILSGLIYIITNPLVEEGLKEEFIVDSEESEGFVYWACKYSLFDAGVCAEEHDSVVFNEAYFVFNLTNVDEVLQGGKPVFEEFGPYFYLVDIVKYDIEFVDDGNQVEYGEARAYYFNPEKSCAGCLPTDEFVGINAGYLGAVDTAGSETLLLLGMGGPVIGKMLQDISSTYVQSLIDADGFDFWLNKCKEIDAECETQFDMAMVQWGYYWKKGRNSTIGLNNLPVNDWNSEIFPAPEAEFSAFSSSLLSITPLNLTQCKLLLYGTKGIVEGPLYLLELLEAALDPEYLAETWGLNTIELANFGRYILSLSDTYDLYLFEDVTVLEQGGGLFSKRSVHQWVFHFEDPLLKYMQPRDPQTAIRYNDTSVEDARSYKPGKMAIFTGKNDFRNVANVTMWNGTTILDFWEEPVPVFGNNQDGQFFLQLTDGKGKLPSPLEDYDIFSPDHGKTIYLADIGQTLETPTGIRLHRYVLRNETYDPNPIYFQTLPGFINASFHMNPPFRKRIEFGAYVPLFLSQPRFWAIESDLVDKVQINTVPNLEECATIVDVEPISGNAMGAYKRLQVNFYFSANSTSTFGRFHSNMTNDVMYPVLFISQEITVTPELEDEWNTALGGILNIIDYIFIIGLIVGSVGFVCCLLGLIILNKRQEGYKAIN